MTRKLLLSLSVLLACSITVYAQTTYYVDINNGDNSNSGTSTTSAWKNIQHASYQVSAGDIVKILPGTYSGGDPTSLWGEVNVYAAGNENAWITFSGVPDANGNLPVIKSASTAAFNIVGASYIIVENIEVTQDPVDVKGMISEPGFGIEYFRRRSGIKTSNGSHHIIIRNNYAHDFGGGGIELGAADNVLVEANLVEHCAFEGEIANSGISTYHAEMHPGNNLPGYPNHRLIFKDNICRYNVNLRGFVAAGNKMTDGNGIIIDDHDQDQSSNPVPYTGRVLIIGNICYGNGGRGINLFSSKHIDVFNNTMFDNAQTTHVTQQYELAMDDGQLVIGKVDDAVIKNNIMVNSNSSTETIGRYWDTNITYENNMHWNSTGNPVPVDATNDIIANPMLSYAVPLTQAQADLLATSTNPFDPNSTSAQLYLPTTNNNFPIQDLRIAAGSPAIDAGVSVGFGNVIGSSIDIGAIESDPNNPAPYNAPAVQSPFGGSAASIVDGTIIEGGHYDTGGEGVAFHESDASNSNSCGRDDEVDVTGGCSIGWVAGGEWLEYTVDITAGTYDITLNATSPNDNRSMRMLIDDVEVAVFDIQNTGSWGNMQPVTVQGVNLAGGSAIMKLEMITGGFNFDDVSFTLVSPPAQNSIVADNPLATTIVAGDTYSASITYNALEDGHLLLKLYDNSTNSWIGVGQHAITVNAGQSGTVNMSFTTDINLVPHSDYLITLTYYKPDWASTWASFPSETVTVTGQASNSLTTTSTLPTALEAGSTYSVDVDYSASETSYVLFKLYDVTGGNWVGIDDDLIALSSGNSGSSTMSFTVPAGQAAHSNYKVTLGLHNADWSATLASIPSVDATVSNTPAQGPFGGAARAVNDGAVIEGGEYDTGGEGVAFHDSDPSNANSCGRDDEVDVVGGCSIAWISAGEWLEYTVDATAGDYDIAMSVENAGSGRHVKLYIDDVEMDDITLPVGNYGEWNDAVFSGISFPAGIHIMKIEFVDGSFNMDDFTFTSVSGSRSATKEVNLDKLFSVYPNPSNGKINISVAQNGAEMKVLDMAGKLILRQPIFEGDTSINLTEYAIKPGIYMVSATGSGIDETRFLIIE